MENITETLEGLTKSEWIVILKIKSEELREQISFAGNLKSNLYKRVEQFNAKFKLTPEEAEQISNLLN